MVTLSYNGSGTGTSPISLVLPSPRLDDSESLELPMHMDRMMDGTIYAYKKQSVPQTRLSMFFEYLNRPLVINAFNFFITSQGQFITLLDYDNILWTGKILNQPITSIAQGIRNSNFTIEFEGTNTIGF